MFQTLLHHLHTALQSANIDAVVPSHRAPFRFHSYVQTMSLSPFFFFNPFWNGNYFTKYLLCSRYYAKHWDTGEEEKHGRHGIPAMYVFITFSCQVSLQAHLEELLSLALSHALDSFKSTDLGVCRVTLNPDPSIVPA